MRTSSFGQSRTGAFGPVFRRLLPRYFTTSVNLCRGMIEVAATAYSKQILFSTDINQLADLAGS
ncbi:MAG: hypothetical protein EHM55_12225 [Acidobacteria bacterium]|nr:MAG: hypothetical protein EHM55_12225 [Acidobacteriota bacterium]